MHECKFCHQKRDLNNTEETLQNSQYINGNYYHNSCIENAQKENVELKGRIEKGINYIDQVIMYKPSAKELDEELNELIGILGGENGKLKRQISYLEELRRCVKEDCDFYLEHNEAVEFEDYIAELEKLLNARLLNENKRVLYNWNELKEGLLSLYDFDEGVLSKDYLDCVEDMLDKMQELEKKRWSND